MNTSKWTYISRTGERSQISIFHSPRLGHFLVFFNRKVLLADKKVFGQDTYSFFIDDELCHITINIVNNHYKYHFSVDKQAETPLNDFRKKNSKKNLYYSILTFSILFLMVATTMISVFHYEDLKKWTSIQANAVLTTAQIEIFELNSGRFHIFYNYRDRNITYRDIIWTYKIPNPVLENGFPVQTEDAFLITYSSKDVTYNKLHLNHPTPQTIQRYKGLAQNQYQKNHPELSNDYCDCVLNAAYDLKEWQGYAIFYNENLSKRDNKRFNQQTYQSFVNSTAFLDKEVGCWAFR